MKKSIEGKKDWLTTVKLARRLYEDRNIKVDEFDTNEALREWIGLPKHKKQNSDNDTSIPGTSVD